MKRKLLVSLLCVLMVAAMMPSMAFAEGTGSNGNVCKIGTTEYASLADAVDAVLDGTETTITMIGDETIVGNAGVTVSKGQNIVLDLNGHTVKNYVNENKGSQVIYNKGTLTIKDSTDTNSNGSGSGLLVNDYDPDTQTGEWWSEPQYNYATNTITNYGTINLASGVIKETAASSICYPIDNNSTEFDSIINISGGKIIGPNVGVRQFANSTTKNNTVNVNGGIIEGGSAGIWIQLPGSSSQKKLATLNVTGGTLKGEYAFYDYSYGDLFDEVQYTLSGGTFDGCIFSYGANVEISKGTFTDYIYLYKNGNNTITQYGGNYGSYFFAKDSATGNNVMCETAGYFMTVADASYCLADGYEVVKNPDYDKSETDITKSAHYPYMIGEKKIAKIGDTTYPSVKAAVEAANDGDTIVMLDDTAFDNSVVIDKDITIDLNGKKITAVETGWKGESPTKQGLFYVKSGAKLTVDDSAGNGEINSSANSSVYSAIVMTIGNDNDESKDAKLVINDGLIKGYYYGVVTNGNRHNTDITINGGKLTGKSESDATSIYHPNRGKLTITGGILEGYDGIAIKGGTPVTITGGEFIATGSKVVPEKAGTSGCNSVGSALYVEGNYGYGAVVTIKGGKFITTDKDAPAILSMFNEEEKSTIEIYDGFFSSKPDSAYIVNGYSAIDNDGKVVSKNDYPWTIGHKVTFKNGDDDYKVVGVKHGEKVDKSLVKNPTLAGNVFAGWFEGNTQFSFDTAINGNKTLTANWIDKDKAEGNITVKTTDSGIKATSSVKKADIPLTPEEVSRVEAGAKIDVNLLIQVEEAKKVEEAEKALIKEAMPEKHSLGMYLDLSMIKLLNGESVGLITETLNPVTVQITVPENLRANGRVYSIVRAHGDEATVLYTGEADKNWNITFETDKFSTYAITFEGGTPIAPSTGDSNGIVNYTLIGLMALMGMALALTLKKRFNR